MAPIFAPSRNPASSTNSHCSENVNGYGSVGMVILINAPTAMSAAKRPHSTMSMVRILLFPIPVISKLPLLFSSRHIKAMAVTPKRTAMAEYSHDKTDRDFHSLPCLQQFF